MGLVGFSASVMGAALRADDVDAEAGANASFQSCLREVTKIGVVGNERDVVVDAGSSDECVGEFGLVAFFAACLLEALGCAPNNRV